MTQTTTTATAETTVHVIGHASNTGVTHYGSELLARAAATFVADSITIARNGGSAVDATDPFAVAGLGVTAGDVLTVSVTTTDADRQYPQRTADYLAHYASAPGTTDND